jgi:putative membrane protein
LIPASGTGAFNFEQDGYVTGDCCLLDKPVRNRIPEIEGNATVKMLKPALVALFAGAFILSSSPVAHADDNKPLAGKDAMFLRKMSEANIAEIQMAKLALRKSRDRKVRSVANMLLKGHRQGQQDVYKVAATHNTALPTQPSAMSRQKYSELASLRGRAFDKAYLAHQVKMHNMTVDMLMKAMADGQDSHTRDLAAKQYGPITEHTEMVYNTAGHFGIPVGATKSASVNRR